MAAMMTSQRLVHNLWIGFLILAVIGSRLLPYQLAVDHPLRPLLWGFTPVLAIFFFGLSQCQPAWLGYAIPLAALVLSDVVLHAASLAPMSFTGHLFIYGCFLLAGSLGWWLRSKPTLLRGVALCWAGPILFFLLTNLAVWFNSVMSVTPHVAYTKDLQGLLTCYAAALPFLRNDILGTSLFMAVLFGCWLPLRRWLAARQAAMIES